MQNSKIVEQRSGDQLRVAITGASGYLGSALVDFFDSKGFLVYRLTSSSRHDGSSSSDQYTIDYSLGEVISPDFFRRNNIDVLIHCAYDFNLVDWKKIEQVNVTGSVELMRAAKEQGVERILFISTMSAFAGCASLYGKAKMAIEREAVRLGATIIRPGLIYSEQSGSMMQKLTKAVRSYPILPRITSARPLYLVHLDDLTLLIFTAVTKGFSADQPIIAASDRGKTFAQILELIAKGEDKTIVLLPVPWRVMWAALKLFESFGLHIGLRSDSVISLVNQDPEPKFEITQKTGIPFRDFGEYIATSSSS